MLDTKYKTTLAFDLKVLAALNGKPGAQEEIVLLIESKKSLWRYKLAVMHRVNQKEIITRQIQLMVILKVFLTELPGKKFKEVYMQRLPDENKS